MIDTDRAFAAAWCHNALAEDVMLTAALALSRVFPVLALRPLSKWALDGLTGDDATQDEEIIRAWWAREPRANVGIGCGRGLFVLDVDGVEGQAALAALPNPLPPTLTTVTAHGFHLYFHTARVRIAHGGSWSPPRSCGILLGPGGWAVAPPSTVVHEQGAHLYRFAGADAPIAEAPAWLVDHLEGQGLASSKGG